MKRYQCIKNVYMPNHAHSFTESAEQILCFKQGNVYQSDSNGEWSEFLDELETRHIITPELLASFKELPPLDDVSAEPDDDRYTMITPGKRIGLGCAIVIAAFLTVLALIFFG